MSLAVLCTFLQPCVVSELVSATHGASELSGHCLDFFFPLFFPLFFFFTCGKWELRVLFRWNSCGTCGGNCLVQPEQITSSQCGTYMTIGYTSTPNTVWWTCGSKSFFHCPRLKGTWHPESFLLSILWPLYRVSASTWICYLDSSLPMCVFCKELNS